MSDMKTSPRGYALIKAFEGFRAQAVPLPDERWVMGYGHTAFARKGAHITRKDANDLLIWDVRKLEPQLAALLFAPVTQNQYDALMALTFNIGIANLAKSDVMRRVNEGCPVDAAAGFDVWRRAELGGEVIVVDALVRRRAAEKALFLTPPDGVVIAPTPQLPPLADTVLARAHDDEVPLDVKIDLDAPDTAPVASEEQSPPPLVADNADEHDEETPVYSSAAAAITSGPVSEVAEKIVRYLDNIGTNERPAGNGLKGDSEEHEALPVMTQSGTEDVLVLSSDDIAATEDANAIPEPAIVDDSGEVLPLYEQEGAASVPWYDESDPDYRQDEDVVPEAMVVDARQSSDFHPAGGRGFLAFILFGIIGLAAVFIGVWQTRLIGQISTLGELLRGPALAVAGVLFIIAAGYNLLRRLGR